VCLEDKVIEYFGVTKSDKGLESLDRWIINGYNANTQTDIASSRAIFIIAVWRSYFKCNLVSEFNEEIF